MRSDKFFAEQKEQSKVKTAIVQKYFTTWANIIIRHLEKTPSPSIDRIAYVDLFAGPGYYEDGTPSTPAVVLQEIVQDAKLAQWVVPIFNDANEEFASRLQAVVDALPGVGALRHGPTIGNQEVGKALVEALQRTELVPSLFFIDPWGYKGVSLALISSAIKDWGSECILFLNMNRVLPAIRNDTVEAPMQELFGADRLAALRLKLQNLPKPDRQPAILEELCAALADAGAKYVLPFGFKDDRGNRTLHYLVHVTKHELGYEIMKDIMARESSLADQGVASFEYSPADQRFPRLFELTRPLDDLEDMLLADFAGCRLAMGQIYRAHHVGTPYISRNYKDILRRMEAEHKIECVPCAEERPMRKGEVTFADSVEVIFPERGEN